MSDIEAALKGKRQNHKKFVRNTTGLGVLGSVGSIIAGACAVVGVGALAATPPGWFLIGAGVVGFALAGTFHYYSSRLDEKDSDLIKAKADKNASAKKNQGGAGRGMAFLNAMVPSKKVKDTVGDGTIRTAPVVNR